MPRGIAVPPLSPLLVAASGAAGTIIASHNRYGPYTRPRVPVSQPHTELQAQMRQALRNVLSRWRRHVTSSQRRDWDRYAAATPYPDRCGRVYARTGHQMYIRANAVRSLYALDYRDDAPVIAGIPPCPICSVYLRREVPRVVVEYAKLPWCEAKHSALLLSVAPPYTRVPTYHRSPYRMAGVIYGGPAHPYHSPQYLPYPWELGMLLPPIRYRLRLLYGDGRTSDPLYL